MRDATRLTQAGKVKEATETIQDALRVSTSVLGAGDAKAAQRAPLESIVHVGEAGDHDEAYLGRPHVRRAPSLPGPMPGTIGEVGRMHSSRTGSPRPSESEARFVEGVFHNEAGTRAYKLYVPRGCEEQGARLVVMLHGCTQSPDDFAAGTGVNAIAEERACLVLYPAQDRLANPQKCWNWFKESDQRRGEGEPSLIAGLTRKIMATYKIDPRHVYVAGLSAGGAMAAIMGATYPDLYAGVCVHSGLTHGAARDLASAMAAMKGKASALTRVVRSSGSSTDPVVRSRRTIVFHGDRDAVVHPSNGDRIIVRGVDGYIMTTGAKPRVSRHSGQVPGGHAYTRYVYQDTEGLTFQEHWVVHGAGHAWSGGSSRASHTDPRGPDAAAEMLRFFEEQP